jgi:DNA-binding YbaB/EbfC family protein
MQSEDDMQPQRQSDMRQLMEQASVLRDRLTAARDELDRMEVTGSAGDGQVVVTLRGTGEPVSVHIDPAVADPDDVATLEQLVLAAIRETQQAIQKFAQETTRIG